MRQSLQAKFNLLGVVLVVFFLLMLPMSTQVKADTRDSMKQFKTTAGWKMGAQVQKFFNPKDLQNAEVEDYWAQQARQKDPTCGAECDPNADRDGDGVSNADEYRNGKDPNCQTHCNPSCNEDTQGVDFCKHQDPTGKVINKNETNPAKPLPVILYNATLSIGKGCSLNTISGTCTAAFPKQNKNLTVVVGYLNITGINGGMFSESATLRPPAGASQQQFSPSPNCTPQCGAAPMGTARVTNAPDGSYTFSATWNQAQPGTQGAQWSLVVYGLVS